LAALQLWLLVIACCRNGSIVRLVIRELERRFDPLFGASELT
jgi:hypothetical protein